jgi:DNA-binding PadR family transcriptional regulator
MTPPVRRSPLALAVLSLLAYRPLHPYGVQRLLKDWGKDQVVNVGQRAGLYKTMQRLHEAGLIEIRETSRDQLYPERTVYALTDAGRRTAQEWLGEILAAPRQEFPEFPAALSFLMMLTPEAIASALEQRRAELASALAALEAGIAASVQQGLPRIARLDDEYLRAVTEAELDWVSTVVEDLRAGALAWSAAELDAFAEQTGTADRAREQRAT